MELFVSVVLPVILYIVAIILLIILIVMGIRIIKILDKIDRVVDNIEEKVNAFNGAFSIIKTTADGLANISDSVVATVGSIVTKLFGRFRKNDKEEEFYE